MGGIFTRKRNLEDFPRASEFRHNFGVPALPFELTVRQCLPTQVTTGYYSNGSLFGQDDVLGQIRDINSSSWLGYSPYDNGHPFITTKNEWDLSHPYVSLSRGQNVYRGPLIPVIPNDGGLQIGFPTLPSFDSAWYGTKAINATVPNKPIADMANALGELRTAGGVPKVMGTILNFSSRAAFARSAGKEYLNAIFGWGPLVRDIESIAGAVINSQKLAEQYLRDSGRQVRRRYEFPEIHKNLSLIQRYDSYGGAFFGLGNNDTFLAEPGTSITDGKFGQVVNHDRKIWFSGAYTYYLELGNDPWSKINLYASLARKLVGARLTPEVLWELQPWSWLVDWVFNVGAILENIESFQTDGLVMKYGYLMCTDKVTSETVIWDHPFRGRFPTVSVKFSTIRKQRIRATPYGFGLDPTTWSPERWAILAALGLTKTPNSLR
jgi:hypothetical protein